MAEDRSLDEFASSGEGSDDEDVDDETVDDTGDVDDETKVRDPDAVESATATYDWSPDGTECEGCGTVVNRRWIDGDVYVCGDCKEW